ncbi:MAG TPA: DUF4399 domain-containing protein [Steroidobacteraceae bacterium]
MRPSIFAAFVLVACASFAQERMAPPAAAEVYIISPKDGAKVTGPVTVLFGLKGMGIAPAGVKFDNTGHHHLLVDMEVPSDLSVPMPATETLLHFGKGQTQTTLTLAPGKHTLQLVFADLNHMALNPPLASKRITITVAK